MADSSDINIDFSDELKEGVIELTDIVEEAEEDVLELTEPIDDISPADDISSVGGTMLTDARIEKALEKVIEKKFGEEISPLLVEIIEKVVKSEMEKIKNRLDIYLTS